MIDKRLELKLSVGTQAIAAMGGAHGDDHLLATSRRDNTAVMIDMARTIDPASHGMLDAVEGYIDSRGFGATGAAISPDGDHAPKRPTRTTKWASAATAWTQPRWSGMRCNRAAPELEKKRLARPVRALDKTRIRDQEELTHHG